MNARRGHRTLPHTADVILEAWGPDVAACCEEAIAALVELFAIPTSTCDLVARVRHVAPGPAEEQLIGLVEDVIFTLDTDDAVPVGAQVAAAPNGGLDVVLHLAARHAVRPAGAVPKAVSRSELNVVSGADEVRCRFLVDV